VKGAGLKRLAPESTGLLDKIDQKLKEQESKQERMGVYAISAKAEDFEGQTIG